MRLKLHLWVIYTLKVAVCRRGIQLKLPGPAARQAAAEAMSWRGLNRIGFPPAKIGEADPALAPAELSHVLSWLSVVKM